MEVWAGGYVQFDLTPVRYLGNTREDGSAAKGQMWVAAVPGGDVIYHWRLTKEASEADTIIPESFRGTLQCDGGSEMACWLRGGKGRGRLRTSRRATAPDAWLTAGANLKTPGSKAAANARSPISSCSQIGELYQVEEEAPRLRPDRGGLLSQPASYVGRPRSVPIMAGWHTRHARRTSHAIVPRAYSAKPSPIP